MFREMVRKKQQLPETECIEILKREKRGVLSLLGDDDYPYGIPLNHYYNETDGKLYFHSGKTVIQHIYDSHFDGAEAVRKMLGSWKELEDRLDPEIYRECLKRFEMQLKNAEQWRDVVNTYFLRKSGIADQHNRKIFV